VIESSMLIHCPTCATSYEVKPSSLGTAGRSVRCVRCRTVWFANARPPEPVAATGQRVSLAHASQTAAATPAMAQSVALGEDIHSAAGEGEPPVFASTPAQAALTEDPASVVGHEPMLDPGARALAMDMASQDGVVDLYEPITMADAPPLAPMDHDASKIPAELPILTGVAKSVDTFVARRSSQPAARPFPMPNLPPLILMLAAIIVGLLGWRTSVVMASPQMASLYAMIGLPVNLRGLAFEDVKTAQETHDGVAVLVIEGAIANVARTALEVPRLRFAMVNSGGNEVYTWTALPSRSTLASGEKLPFRTRLASPPPDGREVVIRFYTRRDAAGASH
jgi:predicted Zn finger-like uncharacterized protein